MRSIGLAHDRGWAMTHPVRSQGRIRTVLLACGVLASLLYATTDILGGLRYPGYSFTSQAVSELAAVGAPTEGLVTPLFLAYDVLALAFAIGVLREAGRRQRALLVTGACLTGHAIVGFVGAAGQDFFQMRVRGTGSLETDAPHIIIMGAIVLLLLLAIAFGAFAFGWRFKIYSLATLLVMLVFGALTASFTTRVAAGLPSPGLGVIERIDVYSPLLWIAVLAVALLRRAPHPAVEASP